MRRGIIRMAGVMSVALAAGAGGCASSTISLAGDTPTSPA